MTSPRLQFASSWTRRGAKKNRLLFRSEIRCSVRERLIGNR